MAAPVRVWLEVLHHPVYRAGGWAWVRQDAGGVSGTAGGERRIDPERAGLAALTAALAGLPKDAAVELHTTSGSVLTIPARIAAAQTGDAPTENLDLWAQAMTALRVPGRVVLSAEPTPGGPSAFATAWAEFARDRAKDRGAFSSPIPKSNLSKAGV